MKRISIYRILSVLVTVTLLFATCTKEPSDVKLDPKLSTSQYYNVTWDSATVVGFVVAAGDGFTERGICYDTAKAPTTAKSKVIFKDSTQTATFIVTLGGLTRLTKYYARAYAISENTTVYGEEITFKTTAAKPVLTDITASVLNKTTDKGITATTEIDITDDGGPDATADITKRGVVYGIFPHPTIDSSKTEEGTGKGKFTSVATNLKGNQKYYLRAYATNKIGTTYSNEVDFTTPVGYASVSTSEVTKITKTTATLSGEITYDGGGTITEKGFCYSKSANPTTANTKVKVTTAGNTITADIVSLDKYTKYHVRTYAINSAGTAYGSDVEFTTLADILTWNVPGDYVETSYPGSGLANWSPDKSPQVISTIAQPNKLEGYVYFGNASNLWKFATQNNWDGPNYGAGASAGIISATGDNISSNKGYYKLNVDAEALTYTAIAMEWGVIGSATPNDWNDETPLNYNPATQTWNGGMHLKAAEIKFRANHSWDYNYGSTAGNATLDAGGTNITIGQEDDYAITLDLSHPNNYTYSVYRWGVIGSATADDWNSDQNMAWDATNKVFKATLTLKVGEMKFRANDDWGVNLGGDLNALTQDGSNIAISTAGSYTITLDPWTKKATITLNKKK